MQADPNKDSQIEMDLKKLLLEQLQHEYALAIASLDNSNFAILVKLAKL